MSDPLYLVTGATGHTGRHVVAGLRAAGHRVRAAARGGETRFDWGDRDSWAPVIDGVDAIYLMPPVGVPDPVQPMIELLTRAREGGTRRVVLHSASITEEGGPVTGQVHAWLRAEMPEWAVVRPTWFAENLLPGHYLGDGIAADGAIRTAVGDGRIPFVDIADIGAVGARALLAPELHGDDLLVTGPQALSYDDVARILSDAAGREIVHERVSGERVQELMRASGIPAEFAPILAGLEAPLAAGAEDRVTPVVAQWTGRPPRSLAAFAAAHADVLAHGAATATVPAAYREHLRAVTGDASALRACWEPDGVLEFPYAPTPGPPGRLEGIDAIVGYFSGSGMFGPFRFGEPWVGRVAATREYVLEIHGSSELLQVGRPYEQDYIVRFGLSPRGRLAWMREFWDPTRITG